MANKPTSNGTAVPEQPTVNGAPRSVGAEYTFTPREQPIIKHAMFEAQAKINELNAMVRLVVKQNDLPDTPDGQWQVKTDGTGMIRVPVQQITPIQ
jgi:hypothetical protein